MSEKKDLNRSQLEAFYAQRQQLNVMFEGPCGLANMGNMLSASRGQAGLYNKLPIRYMRSSKPIRSWSHAAKDNLLIGMEYVKIKRPIIEWVYE